MTKKILLTLMVTILNLSTTWSQTEIDPYTYSSVEDIDSVLATLYDAIVVNTDQVKSILEASNQLNHIEGIIGSHHLLAEHYYQKDSLAEAHHHYQKKYEFVIKTSDKYEESITLGQLASILGAQNKLTEAVEKSHLQLDIAEELNDSSLICDAYTIFFEIYNLATDYKSEIKYLNLAIDYHTKENDGFTIGYLYTMLASVYFSQDDIENAYKYFELADREFKDMETLNIYDEAYFNLHFGNLLVETDSSEVGIEYCNKANIYFSSIGAKQEKVECLSCLLDGYNNIGNKTQENRITDTLEILLKEYNNPYMQYRVYRTKYKNYDFSKYPEQQKIVVDYVESLEDLSLDESKALIYQTDKRLELEQKENSLLLIESNLEKKRLERNFYLIFTALTFLASLFLFYNFIGYRKLKQKSIEILQLKERQKTIENNLLTQKLDYSERDSAIKATLVREFNSKLEDIKTELIKIDLEKQVDHKNSLQNIIRKIDSEIESEDSFVDFLNHFNTIYPHFYDNIQERFPQLNINDKKLCAYIKMNLESKEIAQLLHINKSSVNTARYRLRKKLNLTKSEDLNSFIQNLET